MPSNEGRISRLHLSTFNNGVFAVSSGRTAQSCSNNSIFAVSSGLTSQSCSNNSISTVISRRFHLLSVPLYQKSKRLPAAISGEPSVVQSGSHPSQGVRTNTYKASASVSTMQTFSTALPFFVPVLISFSRSLKGSGGSGVIPRWVRASASRCSA